jgi:hypothetical protein
MTGLDAALWFWTASFSAIALAKIISLGLWRKPPLNAFAVTLLVGVLRDIALSRIPYESHAYTVAWEASLPLTLGSHALAAVAAYAAIADLYPKIGHFAVWLFVSCLALAALCCCGTLPWELNRIGGNQAFVRSLFLLWRWVDGLAAGGLVLASAFLFRFPRPLKRMPSNLLWHTALLAGYFSAYSFAALAENLMPMGAAAWIERAQFAMVALLYAAWTLALSRQGEESAAWEPLAPDEAAAIRRRYEIAVALVRHATK